MLVLVLARPVSCLRLFFLAFSCTYALPFQLEESGLSACMDKSGVATSIL